MASAPEYDVHAAFDVMVEMRDGVRLATDIYRPADPGTGEVVDEPLPALLDRTPYDKRSNLERHGEWFASRGYVVAIQDVRGRFESEGDFFIFVDEAEDGYDTVEWLAEQPYCDGQVGTLGTSYGAWVQSALATQDPPHLEAMFVNQGASNGWEATFRHNGAFELRWLCWAFVHGAGFGAESLADLETQAHFANVDTRDVLANGPLRRGQSPLRRAPSYERWLFDVMTTEGDSELWDEPGLDFAAHYDASADVPTVYAGGWYDSYAKATCDAFEALNAQKESDHFLLVGPWTHGWESYPLPSWSSPHAGEVAFGDDCLLEYQQLRLRFFDHYLKGKATWADQPTVQYWRMGGGDGRKTGAGRLFHGGEWTTAEEWPPSGTTLTSYYAHPDGTLRTERPSIPEGSEDASTTYRFDPTDPVPTLGGNCSSYSAFEQRSETLVQYPLAERETVNITGSGGYDQRTRPETFGATEPYSPVEERDDVLVFRTPPLDRPVEVVGPIRVRVYGETDAPDTDFTAMLLDEYPPSEAFPNGFALNLSDSICRARYRGYRREPDPITPGEVYAFDMEPYPTATVFERGHSIRLDVSSSNFPRYDVNRNTGELYGGRAYRVAHNTVHHSHAHPTHVELPVQPVE
ncbi:CocE/NonD family hydrolase [Salinigranum halophilum]|uniref:CocE/NonD family hydrolase n=1 Tax=Salinigranum halophilum TaxID=2565931 RepID=UPI00115E1F97|nr:CocE/NonD family hydrolase [Salinigranum halophilum]